jgi:hypothetical protein
MKKIKNINISWELLLIINLLFIISIIFFIGEATTYFNKRTYYTIAQVIQLGSFFSTILFLYFFNKYFRKKIK